MTNQFNDTKNKDLIDWFVEVSNAQSGIFVVAGPVGGAIWSTQAKCIDGLKALGKACYAGESRDRYYLEDAVKHANLGDLVIIAMIVDTPENAIQTIKDFAIEGAIDLVRGIIFQRIDTSELSPKLCAIYTKLI